ncbi:probable LRR receptor-like serine/threonine-protein kinase At2g16250 [Coffea eugenioides]|uniref:probable LRR receptor-like serine/threonine-protein kinase At2g16250 n=1 Tax=Coffea eugenioides TaxID=49369 RepID=UPI000F614304|nr:probable LRR receptor-like serine/threonine-protein kinase At2g16250 [Coffea eugenioides]
MAVIYDNWERLVRATLNREELRLIALRTPSEVSSVSLLSASPSFNSSSQIGQVSSLNFRSLSVGDSFTYCQILQATDFLSDSNLIKHGHSGDLYYGVLESGVEVVVKKLHLSPVDTEFYLISELEICGMIYHSRLIPFLGYCFESRNKKFLVYKYMPNKDLSNFLHRESVSGSDEGYSRVPPLDWITRLKIATEAAEGLYYLHHECFPPLVHRDIRASSFLLDADFQVHLGSLAEVCFEEKDSNQNRIARLLRLPKGYEQSNSGTSNATCAYDVYCFGKVLLELITGELGISDANDSIMKAWMENTLRYINPDNKKLIVNIVDPTLITHDLTEVWAVAFVAKACLRATPSKRPQMEEVLEALQGTKSATFTVKNLQRAGHPNSLGPALTRPEITKGSKVLGWTTPSNHITSSCGSSSSGNHEFSDANGTEKVKPNGEILDSPSLCAFTYLELKIATRNFRTDTLLGEGEFGRVHKGLLHYKSTAKSGTQSLIAVKRFYNDTVLGLKDWQAELNILGRLSHPNLVKLLGYCWENEKPLLIYEYMQRGSLDSHLFTWYSDVQPLPWDIRLKILIGAARGLAFLHALERKGSFNQKNMGEGFYRYFKPSKILLDDAYNAKISGYGVTRIDPPDIDYEADPIKCNPESYVYAAPEYYPTGNLLMESDVYGFGVVLVQMLTGECWRI